MVDSAQSPTLQAQDLVTPTLKTPMVTTGRFVNSLLVPGFRSLDHLPKHSQHRYTDSHLSSGGQGNMAKNVDPEETRARQDVGP